MAAIRSGAGRPPRTSRPVLQPYTTALAEVRKRAMEEREKKKKAKRKKTKAKVDGMNKANPKKRKKGHAGGGRKKPRR